MESSYRDYVPLGLFAVFLILSFLIIKPLLLALFLGALLAYVTYSFYRRLRRRLNNKVLAALLICFLVLVIIIVPGVFILKTLIQESYVLFLVGKQRLATGLFRGCENQFCLAIENLGKIPEIQYQIQEGLKAITNWIIEKGSSFLISIPRILLNLFVLFFSMFYFLKDGEDFLHQFSRIFSIREHNYSYLIRRLKEIIRGVVYGYLIVAFLQGAVGAIGFYIFGVSSPLFWGMVMALFALVPYLGTAIIWVPTSIIVFLDGMFSDSGWQMFKGIALFVYGVIVISGLDNILKPKLIGEKARVHPAIAMLGLIGGLFLFGPIGIIAGPLILSLTMVFVDVYIHGK